jgi:tetratricopeptide (TPR) repeat protein
MAKVSAVRATITKADAAKGYALFLAGRYVEALAAHEESLRFDPDSYEVRTGFGLTCMYMGRPEAAIEHFQRH